MLCIREIVHYVVKVTTRWCYLDDGTICVCIVYLNALVITLCSLYYTSLFRHVVPRTVTIIRPYCILIPP